MVGVFSHSVTGREEAAFLIHINKQGHTDTDQRLLFKEKNGHISQAPENVLLILGLVLLIDVCEEEEGV